MDGVSHGGSELSHLLCNHGNTPTIPPSSTCLISLPPLPQRGLGVGWDLGVLMVPRDRKQQLSLCLHPRHRILSEKMTP